MRELYNEGRVVGLSQYESYLKQVLSTNPTATIMNEREWLSASLSSNMSMILRVPAGTTRGVHDFQLPEGSALCGCCTIYASIFEGEITRIPDTNWALRVDDYGRLIRNDLEVHPVTPGGPQQVPTKQEPIEISPVFAQQCRDYLKVTGALMFQPGDWIDNVYYVNVLTESSENVMTETDQELMAPVRDLIAAKSLEPNMAATGFIRLAIDQTIEEDLHILFTGFSYKALVCGEVGYSYVPDVGTPESGDFLGPARFPWGCKIALTVTNPVMKVAMDDMRNMLDEMRGLREG